MQCNAPKNESNCCSVTAVNFNFEIVHTRKKILLKFQLLFFGVFLCNLSAVCVKAGSCFPGVRWPPALYSVALSLLHSV